MITSIYIRESEKDAYGNGVIKGGRLYRHPMPVVANLEFQSVGDEKTDPFWALGFEPGLIKDKPLIIFEVETP